jgi:hypothetical protein
LLYWSFSVAFALLQAFAHRIDVNATQAGAVLLEPLSL